MSELLLGTDYEFSDNGKDWEIGKLNNTCNDQFQSKIDNKTEWYTYIREVKPVTVPVYTQEMCDEGVFPSVGMIVMIDASFSDENGQSFSSRVEDTILGFINGKGIFKDHTTTLDCVVVVDKMHPVTPPIELIDGKAYQFDYNGRTELIGIYHKSDDSFGQYTVTSSAKAATNIQLLEVTK